MSQSMGHGKRRTLKDWTYLREIMGMDMEALEGAYRRKKWVASRQRTVRMSDTLSRT
jgi:hypothetical protein